MVALVTDLMLASRITQALAASTYSVQVVSDAASLQQQAEGAALVLVDLAARNVDVLAAIRELKRPVASDSVPVVAFGPHLDQAAHQAARDAGADAAVANSRLALDLPRLIEQYASRPAS